MTNPITSFQYKADINTTNPDELKYWTSKWNVSPQQIVGAVRATKSSSVTVIEEYLFNRKTRNRRPRYIGQL